MNQKITKSVGVLKLLGFRLLWILLQVFAIRLSFQEIRFTGVGIVQVIMLIRALVQFVDFDTPQGLIRALSIRVEDDIKFTSAFRAGLFIQCITGIVGGLIIGLIPYVPILIRQFRETNLAENVNLLFVIGGLHFCIDNIAGAFLAPLIAREQTNKLANFTSLVPFCSTAILIVLVYIFKSPIALLCGYFSEAILNILIRTIDCVVCNKTRYLLPKYDRAVCSEIFNNGFRSYVGSVTSRVGSHLDKVIVSSVLGEGLGAVYGTACRIPQMLLETLARFGDIISPELIRASRTSGNRFNELFIRNSGFIATLGVCGIMVICAIGEPLVKLLLQNQTSNVGLVVFLMGIYCAFEMNSTSYVRAFAAHNKAYYTIPFSIFNAIVTAVLTKTVALSYGLVGLASMNIAIDLVQFIPLQLYTWKLLLRGSSFKEVVLVPTRIFIVGIFFSVPTYFASKNVSSLSEAVPYYIGVTIVSVLCLVALVKMKFVSVPNGIKQKLGIV
jgi:hypothetical protein